MQFLAILPPPHLKGIVTYFDALDMGGSGAFYGTSKLTWFSINLEIHANIGKNPILTIYTFFYKQSHFLR